MDHLYALGHRHIYMVRNYWNGWEKALLFRGFREAIDSYGLGVADEKFYEIDAWNRHLDKNGYIFPDMDTVSRRVKELLVPIIQNAPRSCAVQTNWPCLFFHACRVLA